MAQAPQDPITALDETSAAMHELYMSWLHAGFTPYEALQLLIGIMAAGIQKNQGDEND